MSNVSDTANDADSADSKDPGSGKQSTATPLDSDDSGTKLSPQRVVNANAAVAGTSRCLGDFELLHEIGRGGMGVVFAARQLSLDKRVAVKVLPFSAIMDQRVVKRFHNEARAAAQLQHRNIVPVYQFGSERGVYYYAMQLIDGVDLGDLIRSLKSAAAPGATDGLPRSDLPIRLPLDLWRRFLCWAQGTASAEGSGEKQSSSILKRDSTRPSDRSKKDTWRSHRLIDFLEKDRTTSMLQYLEAIVNTGIQVADALHYAHEMGIVHRDIKPSNLLLDKEGEVWVSDFGLAQIGDNSDLTATGAMVGTLRYMSPEQLIGKRLGVDHRTDVYSLGVTLYELLTLRDAFSGDSREAIIRKISFDDPPALRRIDRRIPVELETIVTKSLSKNPADRYQTAAELADDLRRFHNNEPIKGRQPTVLQRLARWALRNRRLVTTAGSLLLATFIAAVAVAIISLNLFATTAAALQSEQEQKAEVERLYRRSEGLRLAANSAMALKEDPTRAVLLALEGARRFPGSGTHDAILDALDAKQEYLELGGHTGPVGHLAFNADGTRLISSATRSEFDEGPTAAMVWDTDSGQLVGQLQDTKTITSAVFSPDRFRILTVSSPMPSKATDDVEGQRVGLSPSLWDAVHLKKLLSFPDAFAFEAHLSAFDPEGRRAVFPSLGHAATIYDCVAGHSLVRLSGHDNRVVFAAFSPNGDRVVTASDDNTVRVWNAESGQPIHQFDLWRERDPQNSRCVIESVSFRPDGRELVTGSPEYGIHIWDLQTGQRVNEQHLKGSIAAYWPSAAQMLTHLINGSELSIRNAASGDTFRTLRPDDGVVQRAEISPDGQWIAMQGHADSTLISLWDADRGEVDTMLRGHRAVVNDIAFSPDAKRIATASSDRTVRLWYVANGRDRATYPTRTWFNDPLAIASPDGEQLAVVARDTATAGLLVRIDQPDQTVEVSARVQLRNGTSTRFVASENQRLAIHSIADGKELDSISSPNGSIRTAAINLDGDRVAAATGGNTLLLWFPDEHRQIQLTNRSAPIFALQFNPAGDQLASASADGFVNVWNADTGALLAALQSDAIVLDVDYHPQATQLIAVTDQDRAVLWDLTTFQELRSLKAAGSRFNQVRFSFDGKHVVSYRSSDSAAVHLWDVATGNLVSKLDVTGRVHVAMHPASHEALVTSSDQGAMIWQYDRNLRQPVTDAPMICGQFSVDGSEFVVGSSVPLPDQPWQLTEAPGDFAPSVLQRWRREGLAQVQSIELPSESLFELFLSRDGVALVNCGRHSEVINFDAVTHEQICRIPGHAAQISACLFTSDSSRLITAAWDQKISIWDAGNGRLLKTLVAHQSAINCLAIGHDDRSLLSGAEDGRCILWNLQSGQPEQQFQLAESAIRFVAFHPAGDQFLAVTSDHALHLHDVPAGREIDLDVGVSKISWAEYSPDGATLLVVPHESANTVPDDPAQPQPGERADQRVLIVPLNGSAITSVVHDAPVVTAHFHPAGGQFLSAMQSGTVTLRDASSGRIRWQPPDRGAIVTAAVMSGSGKYAAVAGHDRVNVWRVEDNLLWLTLPTMVRFPTPVHRFNPFVPNASIVLTQRMDSLEFRSWPLEPVEFAESQSLRPLTPQEKAEFLLD